MANKGDRAGPRARTRWRIEQIGASSHLGGTDAVHTMRSRRASAGNSRNHSAATSTRSLGASGFRAVLPDGSDLWAGAAALSGSTLTVTPTTWPRPCS